MLRDHPAFGGVKFGKPKDGCPHFSTSVDEHIITAIGRQSPAFFPENSFVPPLVSLSYTLYNEIATEPFPRDR